MLNTNALHNMLNIVISLSGLLVAILLASGCTQLATGALECSQSSISPKITGYAIAGLGALKVLVNIGRDGLSGLIKPQPPVQK
jgi:TRAP-type C4-dicarboxylate transport system permease small subunit